MQCVKLAAEISAGGQGVLYAVIRKFMCETSVILCMCQQETETEPVYAAKVSYTVSYEIEVWSGPDSPPKAVSSSTHKLVSTPNLGAQAYSVQEEGQVTLFFPQSLPSPPFISTCALSWYACASAACPVHYLSDLGFNLAVVVANSPFLYFQHCVPSMVGRT